MSMHSGKWMAGAISVSDEAPAVSTAPVLGGGDRRGTAASVGALAVCDGPEYAGRPPAAGVSSVRPALI
jgi:hypothetical protein